MRLYCQLLEIPFLFQFYYLSRYLIESLQKSYLISKKISLKIDNYSKETTPFNQIFGGYMRQDVTCLRCKYVSTTFQHFMDVLLDIRWVYFLSNGTYFEFYISTLQISRQH